MCTHGLLTAPHSTFTHQVRGVTAPDIYGKAGLSSEVKARVRTQTLAAFRCGDIAARLQSQGTPWIIVSPCSEEPSLFDLPEVCGLLSHPEVNQAQVDLQDFSCAYHNIIRAGLNQTEGKTISRYAAKKSCAFIGARLHLDFGGHRTRPDQPDQDHLRQPGLTQIVFHGEVKRRPTECQRSPRGREQVGDCGAS